MSDHGSTRERADAVARVAAAIADLLEGDGIDIDAPARWQLRGVIAEALDAAGWRVLSGSPTRGSQDATRAAQPDEDG